MQPQPQAATALPQAAVGRCAQWAALPQPTSATRRTRLAQDLGVDEHDVRHRQKGGNARLDLPPDAGAALRDMEIPADKALAAAAGRADCCAVVAIGYCMRGQRGSGDDVLER